MLLVEVWRVQRGLGWYVLGVIVLALMAISIGHNASLTVNDKNELAQLGVAASALIPLPLVTACGFATFVGAALVAQNDVLDLAWTKPIPREVIALRIIAVDLVAVAGAFVFGLGAVFAVGLLVHVTPHLDPAFPSALLLGLGVALMWCALTLALTARLRRGGWVGGVMWPVSFLCIGLAQIGGPVGAIGRAINLINPLAYFSGSRVSDSGALSLDSVFGFPVEERALIVWLLAALFCLAATLLWSRREA